MLNRPRDGFFSEVFLYYTRTRVVYFSSFRGFLSPSYLTQQTEKVVKTMYPCRLSQFFRGLASPDQQCSLIVMVQFTFVSFHNIILLHLSYIFCPKQLVSRDCVKRLDIMLDTQVGHIVKVQLYVRKCDRYITVHPQGSVCHHHKRASICLLLSYIAR